MAKLIFTYLFHFLSLHLPVITRLRINLAEGCLSRNTLLSVDLVIRITTKWSSRPVQREGVYCVIIQTLKGRHCRSHACSRLCHQTGQRKWLGGGKRHWSFLIEVYSYLTVRARGKILHVISPHSQKKVKRSGSLADPSSVIQEVFKKEYRPLSLWSQAPFTELVSPHPKSQLPVASVLSA